MSVGARQVEMKEHSGAPAAANLVKQETDYNQVMQGVEQIDLSARNPVLAKDEEAHA